MTLMTEKYYQEKNLFCFFQPKPKVNADVVSLQNTTDLFHNPVEKHRVPTPRLVPRSAY